MQPNSTIRSPRAAFSPVVSVSRTTLRIGISAERFYALVCKRIGSLVFRMPGVSLHPVPGDAVRSGEAIELLPQVHVLDRLLVGGAPAAALPVGQPFAD